MSLPTAAQIARSVNEGARTAQGVAKETLARVKAYDAVQPEVWISRFDDADVIAQAGAVDARLAAGERLTLAGAPFAVKDNIDVAGLPTTAACPQFAYEPQSDSAAVARLRAAGAIVIGKTNLDQFATGLVGTRSPHGACACVFNRAFISGGSSSGSAVAVAAGLVPFALGTDTAGSGRVPAAFNGVWGLKPTRGRWSAHGVVPACRSLDCVSLFTADATDAALIDAVLTGFDPADPFSRTAEAAPAANGRLGFVPADMLDWRGDGQSRRLYEEMLDRARAAGLELTKIDAGPLLDCARLLYEGPWVAERAAALGDFLRRRPGAVHPVVRAIIQGGAGLSAVQAFEGLYALEAHKRAAQAIWREAGALVLPTAPTIYRIAEVLAEPFALNAALGAYTNFVNLLDMAAVAAPAGFRENGTGFGVSLIGPAWSEARLLALAEKIASHAAPPPLDLAQRSESVRLAVVGAHLLGMPLHWQLASRGARLVGARRTAPAYRLYALAGAAPAKPALVHVGEGGASIEVEVYELGVAEFGAFVAEVPAPMAIGSLSLESGEEVKGFVAEPRATEGARDITASGGWRAFLAAEAG